MLMRPDMAKVLVERPRCGGYLDFGDRLARFERRSRDRDDHDVLPFRMKTGAFKTKYLNENLAPLRRFLRRSIGRRWDDVHAEIRRYLRTTNPVQLHVMQHVEDYVYFGRRDGDRILLTTRKGRSPLVLRDGWIEPWYASERLVYVCPDSGRLRAFPRRPT